MSELPSLRQAALRGVCWIETERFHPHWELTAARFKHKRTVTTVVLFPTLSKTVFQHHLQRTAPLLLGEQQLFGMVGRAKCKCQPHASSWLQLAGGRFSHSGVPRGTEMLPMDAKGWAQTQSKGLLYKPVSAFYTVHSHVPQEPWGSRNPKGTAHSPALIPAHPPEDRCCQYRPQTELQGMTFQSNEGDLGPCI